MNKWYTIFTMLVLSVVFAACSGSDGGDDDANEEAVPTESGDEAAPVESEGSDSAEAEGSDAAEAEQEQEGQGEHAAAEIGELGAMLASLDGSANIEVACASCIYGMEGIEDCVLAANVDGKKYLVTGIEFDTHEQGLCMDTGTARLAKITGEVHEHGIEATSVEMTD